MGNSVFISPDDISIFEESFIKNVDKIVYSKNNLIIGENGSGKTRFLKALEKQRQLTSDNVDKTVTLYFPEISSNMPETQQNIVIEIDEQNHFIFDVLRGNVDISFKDFLKIVERANDRCSFIKEFFKLTRIDAPKEHTKAVNTLNKFNDMFKILLNRQFAEEENRFVVNKYFLNELIHSSALEDAFKPEEISPGELMLFYFMLFLYYIEDTCNKKIIVLIDEPEQHLHPQKQIYLIRKLMESEIVSELWVASHSLFLIPLFDFEGLILMQNSCVLQRSSNTYKDSFNSLVGLENIDVFEFLKSLNSWQYYQFILECFCSPKTKEVVDNTDKQFRNTLHKLKEKQTNEPLKILDYGAGKCRLWDCLKLEYPERNELDKILEYTAYEPFPEEGFVYDSSIRVVKSPDELKDLYNMGFDVVILMNVLHEIPVIEWLSTLQNIYMLLNSNGLLVFVEVKNLTNGEQPYGNGYLVLSDEQAKILFKNIGKSNLNNDLDKSNLWTIDRYSLAIVDLPKVKLCIESLRDCTESKLKEAFLEKMDVAKRNDVNKKDVYIQARKYAFLSQQYINAKFALEEIDKFIFKLEIDKKNITYDNVPPPPVK